MVIVLVIAGWLLCAIGAAGFVFAEFQGRFPVIAAEDRRVDLSFALLMGLLGGPISLVVALLLSGFGEYGWRLR